MLRMISACRQMFVRAVKSGTHTLRIRVGNRRTEDALRKSEATVRSILQAAPVGICIMKNRVFESVNDCWCKHFKYSEADILGKSIRFLYESDAEWSRVGRILYTDLHTKRQVSVETRLRCSDGSLREVMVSSAAIQPEDLSAGTVAIIHDITNYKNAERKLNQYHTRLEEMVASRTAELQAANEQLEAIFQAANVGIAVLRDRIVMRCNARLEAILGYAPGSNSTLSILRAETAA